MQDHGGASVPSFTGEFRHSIDAKGRLIVPSRLRPNLDNDEVVLTRWLENCIALWSSAGWEEIEARLREQGSSSAAARAFVRSVASSAYRDQIDKQGRISVPQHLRELAGIDRDVVVIGALNRAEIWSPDRWNEQQEQVEEGRLEELAQELNF
jgi:MraZ protein